MVKQAVILCGGRGKRLRPMTDIVPKPMVEVCGRPFVSYLVTILRNTGVEDIALSVGYLKEHFYSLQGVRLSEAQPIVNDSVLAVDGLADLFVLANGDCLPILRWKDFLSIGGPRVAIKSENGDVGICIMDRNLIPSVNCGNMKGLIKDSRFDKFLAYGNLSIDTPEKLERARKFMSWWWREKE